MPRTRKLRKQDILTDLDTGDWEDEFASAAEDPFAASTTAPVATKPKVSSISLMDLPIVESSSSLDPTIPKYSCDIDLPAVGLELDVKLLLVDLIDGVKGFKSITRGSRLLANWASDHPDELGVPGSLRRKRVKYLVDRWKRDPNFDYTKRSLLQQKKQLTRQLACLQDTTTTVCWSFSDPEASLFAGIIW
jgi:hypothetical protein